MKKDYHCCATCEHFFISRRGGEKLVRCKRLGYNTKPSYKFDCWSPRPDIREKMDRQLDDEAKTQS